ncbi:hypothetical protein C8Q78DRAFT_17306 [Trametes maxima]|nr:hypothetical protein C8Q78DRAFT_17306 [Trametes maxima]
MSWLFTTLTGDHPAPSRLEPSWSGRPTALCSAERRVSQLRRCPLSRPVRDQKGGVRSPASVQNDDGDDRRGRTVASRRGSPSVIRKFEHRRRPENFSARAQALSRDVPPQASCAPDREARDVSPALALHRKGARGRGGALVGPGIDKGSRGSGQYDGERTGPRVSSRRQPEHRLMLISLLVGVPAPGAPRNELPDPLPELSSTVPSVVGTNPPSRSAPPPHPHPIPVATPPGHTHTVRVGVPPLHDDDRADDDDCADGVRATPNEIGPFEQGPCTCGRRCTPPIFPTSRLRTATPSDESTVADSQTQLTFVLVFPVLRSEN